MNPVKDTKFAFAKAHEITWEHGHWHLYNKVRMEGIIEVKPA